MKTIQSLIVVLSLAFAGVIAGAPVSRADQGDCAKFSDCVSQTDSHAVGFLRHNESASTDLGLLRGPGLDFNFDRWMWTKFDKAAVLAKNPEGPTKAFNAFGDFINGVVTCANSYSGRNYRRGEVNCVRPYSEDLNRSLYAALADGYLQQLGLVTTTTKRYEEFGNTYTEVSSPILRRMGIPGLMCNGDTGCVVEYAPGRLAEKPPKVVARETGVDTDVEPPKTVVQDQAGPRPAEKLPTGTLGDSIRGIY